MHLYAIKIEKLAKEVFLDDADIGDKALIDKLKRMTLTDMLALVNIYPQPFGGDRG